MTWKDAAVAYFTLLSPNFLERLEQNTYKLQSVQPTSGRESNTGFP